MASPGSRVSMNIQADQLDVDATYKLLTGIVVPRPVAWITTLSDSGVVNLAPFSAFTFVLSQPPMIGVSLGRKAGVRKDTANHMWNSREFVVNIGDQTHLEKIHESSGEYPPEVSEVDLLGLAIAPSLHIKVPRLADVPVSMECTLSQVIEFGNIGTEFFVGEVLAYHIRDGLYRNGKVETRELNPVCRLGGPNYATLGEVITLRRIDLTPRGATRAVTR